MARRVPPCLRVFAKFYREKNVSCQAFEMDLAHLERIVPQLVATSPLGLEYWRGRITSLKSMQGLDPDCIKRAARLLRLVDQIEDQSESHANKVRGGV